MCGFRHRRSTYHTIAPFPIPPNCAFCHLRLSNLPLFLLWRNILTDRGLARAFFVQIAQELVLQHLKSITLHLLNALGTILQLAQQSILVARVHLDAHFLTFFVRLARSGTILLRLEHLRWEDALLVAIACAAVQYVIELRE